MGKSVAFVDLFYWMDPNAVVLITVYAKNEKENLTDADKRKSARSSKTSAAPIER